MTNIAERLSSYARSLQYEDLPPGVVHLAKRMIIDTLGCALGGYDGEPSRIPDQCIAKIKALQKEGIEYLGCTFSMGGMEHSKLMRSMELFAKEVMPHFA